MVPCSLSIARCRNLKSLSVTQQTSSTVKHIPALLIRLQYFLSRLKPSLWRLQLMPCPGPGPGRCSQLGCSKPPQLHFLDTKYPRVAPLVIPLQAKKQIIQGIQVAEVDRCGDFLESSSAGKTCRLLGSVGSRYVAFLQLSELWNLLASTFSTAHLPAAAGEAAGAAGGRRQWRVAAQLHFCISAKVQCTNPWGRPHPPKRVNFQTNSSGP